MTAKYKAIVLDTAAFIKGLDLYDKAEELYTTSSVIEEIKDPNARAKLALTTYKIMSPDPEDTTEVIRFAKLTGDFESLSSADIQVIALTHKLERINNGNSTSHLIQAPNINLTSLLKTTPRAGPSSQALASNDKANVKFLPSKAIKFDVNQFLIAKSFDQYCLATGIDLDTVYPPAASGDLAEELADMELDSRDGEEAAEDSADASDSDLERLFGGDAEGTWITEDNLEEFQEKHSAFCEATPEMNVKVACATRDLAMQNVILQKGMNLIGIDGLVIKQLSTYIYKCHACNYVAGTRSAHFCPSCGSPNTLLKYPLRMGRNGEVHINPNYKPRIVKQARFEIPVHRPGHDMSGIYVRPDQKEYLRKMDEINKAKKKLNKEIDRIDLVDTFTSASYIEKDIRVNHDKRSTARKRVHKKNTIAY